jgi:hypothetical protein
MEIIAREVVLSLQGCGYFRRGAALSLINVCKMYKIYNHTEKTEFKRGDKRLKRFQPLCLQEIIFAEFLVSFLCGSASKLVCISSHKRNPHAYSGG